MRQYEGLFWDEILCVTSENRARWVNKCNACYDAKTFIPVLEPAAISNYKQWENVYVKKQEKK